MPYIISPSLMWVTSHCIVKLSEIFSSTEKYRGATHDNSSTVGVRKLRKWITPAALKWARSVKTGTFGAKRARVSSLTVGAVSKSR